MFKFKEEADGKSKMENVLATKAMLEALPAKIPQILSSRVEIGAEGANPENADLILISDFESLRESTLPYNLNQYCVNGVASVAGAALVFAG